MISAEGKESLSSSLTENSVAGVGRAALGGKSKWSRGAAETFITPLALIILVVVARWRALFCFFHADDFICIDNLHRIFHGDPFFILQRLVSPWQNPHVQLLYRPLADVFFCIDYAFWGSNSFGYHLTNLLLHSAVTVVLYFICLEVFTAFGRASRTIPAVLVSAFFAVNPLYTESVVWVVGRMDLLCGMFVLAALAVFLKARSVANARGWITAALALQILALLSKEVAVVLPAVLVTSNLLLSLKESQPEKNAQDLPQRNLSLRVANLFHRTVPFWIATACFIAVRTCVLGQFPGGYIGAHGEALAETMPGRLMQMSTFERIFQPLPLWLFPQDSIEAVLMHSLFVVAGLVLLVRIPFLPWDSKTLRVIAWSLACAFITLAPSMQIYQISSTLAGGRLLYLPGTFLAIAVVAALFPLAQDGTGLIRIFRAAALTVVSITILLYAVISFHVVSAWEDGGNVLRKLRSEISSCVSKLSPNRKLVVLNLPGENFGAYLLFGLYELKVLVGPEFCSPDCGNRIASTDIYPLLSPISAQRLTRLRKDPDYEVRWYDATTGKLQPISEQTSTASYPEVAPQLRMKRLDSGSEDDARYFVTLKPSHGVLVGDQAKISLSFKGSSTGSECLRWSALDQQGYESDTTKTWLSAIFSDGIRRDVYAPLLDVNRHLPDGQAMKFVLSIPQQGFSHRLHSVELISSKNITRLTPDLATENEKPDGTCVIKGSTAAFFVDASSVPSADSVVIEISRSDVMFNFSRVRSCRSEKNKRPGRVETRKGVKLRFELSTDTLPGKGRYQLRAGALNNKGELTGLFSDPVAFLVGCDE